MKISVIVPIYKVENYIEKCLDSIINQTFKDFELILVNDNSPDDSINIAKSFLKKNSYLNYKIIDKNLNEGLSAARNSGMSIANGEFFLFVDSDDYLESNMLEMLESKIINETIDIVVCNAYRISNDLLTKQFLFKSPFKGIVNGSEAAISLLKFEEKNFVFRCLFHRSLIVESNFPMSVYYEDALIMPIIWSKARNLYFLENELYAYRDNPGSITNNVGKINMYWLIPDYLDDLMNYFKYYKNGILYNYSVSFSYTWIRNLSLTISKEKNFSVVNELLSKFSSFLKTSIILSNKNIIKDVKLIMQLLIIKVNTKLFWYQFSRK